MGFNLKNLFTKVTKEDKGNFYCFERIWSLAPRHYIMSGCTEGFAALMERSSIPCKCYSGKVETEGRGLLEFEYSSENLATLLAAIMKGEEI